MSLVHPSKFQPVSCLCFVTALTSINGAQPNFASCLAISWAGTLHIHFWGLLPCNGILPCAKFTVHPSLAFSYIGSVTARQSKHAKSVVAICNQRLYLLAQLKKQGLGIRALDSAFNASVLNKILYALPVYFGYLTEGHKDM